MIDWNSKKCTIVTNPHHDLPGPPEMESHFIVSTSGSKKPKWVYLSKPAFLDGAKLVNNKLGAKTSDRWLIALPLFHVGGIAILARCHVSGSSYQIYSQKKWDSAKFLQELEDCHYTSLVPTQLFDLIKDHQRPPPSLKGVLIGGDKLNRNLFDKATALGWPIYRSYGMTETSAAIAISSCQGWELKALPHAEIKVERSIKVKCSSLLTAYFDTNFFDPKVEGWFDTYDEGILTGDTFDVIGRLNQFKIGGELFSLSDLQFKLDHLNTIGAEAVLTVKPCERLGSKIMLYHNHPHIDLIIEHYNTLVHPLVRIKEHIFMEQLPRNAVGKIVVN